MNPTAFGLILFSAVMHAVWNMLLKRAHNKIVFTWMASVWAAALSAPVLIYFYQPLALAGWAILAVSAIVEVFYYMLLARTYQQAALSASYPITRGAAPLFVAALAFVFLGERPSPIGLAGIVLIVGGIFTLNMGTFSREGLVAQLRIARQPGFVTALLTALMTAIYTVLDRTGLTYTAPVVYNGLLLITVGLMLSAVMLPRYGLELKEEFRLNGTTSLVVGAMLAFGYFIVLTASTMSKVSYLSALRGVSIVFGVIISAVFLRERLTAPKVCGGLVIFAGMMCLGLAR